MQTKQYIFSNVSEQKSARNALKFGIPTMRAHALQVHHNRANSLPTRPTTYDLGAKSPTTEAAWANWEKCFLIWKNSGQERSAASVLFASTVWRKLFLKANERGLAFPQRLAPLLMDEFKRDMESRGLSPQSIRTRLMVLNDISNAIFWDGMKSVA